MNTESYKTSADHISYELVLRTNKNHTKKLVAKKNIRLAITYKVGLICPSQQIVLYGLAL